MLDISIWQKVKLWPVFNVCGKVVWTNNVKTPLLLTFWVICVW